MALTSQSKIVDGGNISERIITLFTTEQNSHLKWKREKLVVE